MKTKALKEKDLALLRDEMAESRDAFLVQFQGLTVVAVDDLRRRVREADGTYRVVKNTLARKASGGTRLEGLAGQFRGPTALVVARQDPAKLAKVLTEFAKTNPAVIVKGGVVDGAVLDEAACKQVADLPSREQLLAKLAYLLQSPLQRLATVLSAPQRNLAVVLSEVSRKKA